jgi:hypothetical protein
MSRIRSDSLPDMDAVLRRIEQALPSVAWSRLPDEPVDPAAEHRTTTWKGVAPGLLLTIIRWESTKGPGSGCDGAAAMGSTIIHLSRDLAKDAYRLALAATGG